MCTAFPAMPAPKMPGRLVDDYLGALRELEDSKSPDLTVDEVARRHSSNLRWDRELKNNLRRRKAMAYASDKVWTTQSRPFVKQRCYAEYNKKKRPVISLFSGAMGLDPRARSSLPGHRGRA